MYLVIYRNDYNPEDEKILTRLGIDIEPGINGMIVNVPYRFSSTSMDHDFTLEVLSRLGITRWTVREDYID